MKIVVKTTGSFSLIDSLHGQEIPKDRPVVVYHSTKVAQFLKRKQVEKVCDIPKDVWEEATDEGFVPFWTESQGDEDLAIAAYISSLEETAAAEPVVPLKGKGRGKKAES